MSTKDQRYFSKVAGSVFHFPDGFSIQFAHGFFDLKEEDYVGKVFHVNVMNGNPPDPRNGQPAFDCYKEELDKLIRVGNPLLYIQGSQPQQLPNVGADSNAKSEGEMAQALAAERTVKGKATGDANVGTTLSDPNVSTVDPTLQALVLAPRGENSKLAQIRAEAAAKSIAANSAGGSASGT